MNKPVLQLDNVSVAINTALVLQDVAFNLNSGEILALIGPNGAGKSTLISAICGAHDLATGKIQFQQQDLGQWLPIQRARHLAVLPQQSHLNFPFTVEEVVGFGRTPHGSGIAADNDIIDQVMAELDIAGLRRRRYTELSGGEQQRTQLARVFAQIWREQDAPGRLLILDEPTAALDIGHKQALMRSLQKLVADKVAVLWVEHDLNLVGQFAHNLLALQSGCVRAYGPTARYLDRSLVNTLFDADVRFVEDPNSDQKAMLL